MGVDGSMTAPTAATGRRAFLALLVGLTATGIAGAEPPRLDVASRFPADLPPDDRAALDRWFASLRPRIDIWWPVLLTRLASPGDTPPRAIEIVFATIEPRTVPAATSGTRIFVDHGSLLSRIDDPDTFGMIAHELVHVAQHYPRGASEWLAEGIADYLRYYVLLPDDPGRVFDARSADWKAGYQPAAALLDWIERSKPGTVRAVNAAMRSGKDGEAALRAITRASPRALWQAYLAG